MSQASPELKAKLTALGKWGDFCFVRDEFKAHGLTPAESRYKAVLKVCPELSDLVHSKPGRPRKAKEKKYVSKVTPVKMVDIAEDDLKSAPAPGEVSLPQKVIDPKWFVGKKARWGEVIDWVIGNLCFDVADVDLADAPDAKAATYFLECKKSLAFQSEFMLKMGSLRMPKKVEEEESNTLGDFDGKGEYDVLAVIAEGGK